MDDLDFLQSNEVHGVYRALVVNDKDPKRMGRIQFRIPSIHGIPLVSDSYVPDKELPWAPPASMSGLGVNQGQLIIPQPGMTVFIIFEADSIKYPLYLGTASLVTNAYVIGDKAKNSDAKLTGIYDSEGNVVKDLIFRSATGKSIYVDRLTGELNVDIDILDSVDGLAGGKLTSPLIFDGGDGLTANKIVMSNTGNGGQITDDTTSTLFGFIGSSATDLTVGSNSYGLNLRGSGNRPKYKGNDLALYSDLEYDNIANIPDNIYAVAELSGSGYALRNADGTWSLTSGTSTTSVNGLSGGTITSQVTIKYSQDNDYALILNDTDTNYFGQIDFDSSSGSQTYTLPAKSGTIALKSDIPSSIDGLSGGAISSATSVKGTFTVKKADDSDALTIDQNGDVNGRYLKGTWLYTSAATDASNWTDVFVNVGGWLYKRSKANIKADLGTTINPVLLTTGTFNSSGYFNINVTQITFTEGLYFFTYGNTQAFVWLTTEMFQNSGYSPIRAAIAVIYNSSGSAQPGFLRLQMTSQTNLQVKVANENHHVYQGFEMKIYKAL